MRTLLDATYLHEAEFTAIHTCNKYIGSSTIATIAGLNPYCSPFQEWCYRTNKQPRPDISKKIAVRRGKALEPLLGELFAEKHGMSVIPCYQVLQHETIDWAICSPDFYAWPADTSYRAIVEAKDVRWNPGKQWTDTTAPDYYQCQVQWQLGIDEDSREAYFSALVMGTNHFTPKVERSKEIFEQLLELASKFLDAVKQDIPLGSWEHGENNSVAD